MSPTFEAFLRSWPSSPWLTASLLISGAIYARGWFRLNRRDPSRWHLGRLGAFLGSLTAIFLALASPIEPFASLLLQVHMLQHLLLMMVAPPLLWLGWPLFPMIRGLPEPVRTYWVLPLLRWRMLRIVFASLTHPVVAWTVYVGTTWIWHTPRGYELGLSQNSWHIAEHACFLASSLLFWYPVVRPYPSRPRWAKWLLFPYLLLADVQNTVLGAWLTFSPTVLYSHYSEVSRVAGISALDDQRAAGVLMWVPGSIAFLLPLFWIGVRYLFGSPCDGNRKPVQRRTTPPVEKVHPIPLPPVASSSYRSESRQSAFDLLGIPIIGDFLRWRFSRPVLQLAMVTLATVVIFDGLYGPQVSPMNLAGVLPWIHWRGLLILGLLVIGNLFCLACPFTLPRSIARRWLPIGRPWPRWLRSKWLAVGLVAMFLWSYEAFALWDSPWITAWIAIAYFLAAFIVDSCFRDAAFCKYVCPIGQFNFIQSLVSPFEVKVREATVCESCRTKECIRGSATISGCGLQLYQPRKHGNLDCTYCLDCVHACPHENVGVLAVVPGRSLWSDRYRSGIGRLTQRPDLTALAIVLVFGAFANAAGMVAPVLEWQDQLHSQVGKPPRILVTTIFYFLAIIVLPYAAVRCAAITSRAWIVNSESWQAVAMRYSWALIPIGFGMWLAHYSFHLLTSAETVIPATQRFIAEMGSGLLGKPMWQCACCRPTGIWITNLEVVMLDFGLLLSLYTGFRIAESHTASSAGALKAFSPWALVIVMLFVLGVWIVFQPMEMRGTLPGGGLAAIRVAAPVE